MAFLLFNLEILKIWKAAEKIDYSSFSKSDFFVEESSFPIVKTETKVFQILCFVRLSRNWMSSMHKNPDIPIVLKIAIDFVYLLIQLAPLPQTSLFQFFFHCKRLIWYDFPDRNEHWWETCIRIPKVGNFERVLPFMIIHHFQIRISLRLQVCFFSSKC